MALARLPGYPARQGNGDLGLVLIVPDLWLLWSRLVALVSFLMDVSHERREANTYQSAWLENGLN
jgi:hypothetical protein